MACVALFDTDFNFLWQAWHFLTSTFMLRGKRGTFGHRPSCCVAGVALGNIVLTTIFSHRFLFGPVLALERARLPGIVVMICIILCSKVSRKWLCSKVILLPLAACHGNAIASRRSRTCIYHEILTNLPTACGRLRANTSKIPQHMLFKDNATVFWDSEFLSA